MTDQNTPPLGQASRLSPVVVISLLVAFLAILGAYVFLSHQGDDAGGLIQAVLVLAGFLGLGGTVERTRRQANAQLNQIREQTNGVLDRRIREGVSAALAERDARRGRS